MVTADWIWARDLLLEIKGKDRATLKKSQHLLWEWLQRVQANPDLPNRTNTSTWRAIADPHTTKKESIVEIIGKSLVGDPKMTVLLDLLANVVVLREKKLLVWMDYAPLQLKLFHICRMLNIPVEILHPEMSSTEQEKVKSDFTSRRDRCHVLILSPKMGGVGLNLQYMCNDMIFYNTPLNEALRIQFIGRLRRMYSCGPVVNVTELGVIGTFSDYLENRSYFRSLPGLMALLDHEYVWGTSEMPVETNYVLDNGRMVRASEDNTHLPRLTAAEITERCMLPRMCRPITVRSREAQPPPPYRTLDPEYDYSSGNDDRAGSDSDDSLPASPMVVESD